MLDLATEETDEQIEQILNSTVEFSEIKIGDRFMTDRWLWEKVGADTAKALSELMGKSGKLLGSVVHFRSWTEVRLIRES